MTTSVTEDLDGDQAVGVLPQLSIRGPKSAVITVTERDDNQVTVSTWSTCHGVAAFVRDLLGEPGQQVTINANTHP